MYGKPVHSRSQYSSTHSVADKSAEFVQGREYAIRRGSLHGTDSSRMTPLEDNNKSTTRTKKEEYEKNLKAIEAKIVNQIKQEE